MAADKAHPEIEWRSRIVRSGKIKASEVTPHPNNPRKHPELQRHVVADSFSELGQISRIVINVNNGYLVDGEERVWLALDQPGDVELDADFVDLTDEEHLKALAYLDASGSLATYDKVNIETIMRDISTQSEAIQAMLSTIASEAIVIDGSGGSGGLPMGGKQTTTSQLTYLHYGKVKIALTPEEIELMDAALSDYLIAHGSYVGFIHDLLS